jgi:hypothetical protein
VAVRSYHKKRAIRVFRSSILNGGYSSSYLDEDEEDEIGCRYDGLYMVRAVWDIHGNETEASPSTGEEGWQTSTSLRDCPKSHWTAGPNRTFNTTPVTEHVRQ